MIFLRLQYKLINMNNILQEFIVKFMLFSFLL